MNPKKNTKLTDISKILRRNMTLEERHLWYDFLKSLPQTVQRQKVIGNYVADFYIAAAHAIIELDGAQHYDEENRDADRVRDEFMYAHGRPSRICTLNYDRQICAALSSVGRKKSSARKGNPADDSLLGTAVTHRQSAWCHTAAGNGGREER